MENRANPLGRPKGKPRRVRDGWVAEFGSVVRARGRDGDFIEAKAVVVTGSLGGAYLHHAGGDRDGQTFAMSGDPDFLDELAAALRLLAKDIRLNAGWNNLDY